MFILISQALFSEKRIIKLEYFGLRKDLRIKLFEHQQKNSVLTVAIIILFLTTIQLETQH